MHPVGVSGRWNLVGALALVYFAGVGVHAVVQGQGERGVVPLLLALVGAVGLTLGHRARRDATDTRLLAQMTAFYSALAAALVAVTVVLLVSGIVHWHHGGSPSIGLAVALAPLAYMACVGADAVRRRRTALRRGPVGDEEETPPPTS